MDATEWVTRIILSLRIGGDSSLEAVEFHWKLATMHLVISQQYLTLSNANLAD